MTPQQYRYLIAQLVKTVVQAGGRMRTHDAELATARRLGISPSTMQGVVINAHADKALVFDLRSDSLSVAGQTGEEN